MATYLDEILSAHRAAAAADTRPLAPLVEAARVVGGARDFSAAIAPSARLHVIAELKRRSPKKGELAADVVAGVIAKAYETGGASCLSVLTDRDFFAGSPEDLAEARAACELPVLRKDFTVSERDVCDARLMGADAVLLIAAALSDAELRAFGDLASEVGLAALVETHDEHEVERALAAGATIIGVNQRDLRTFQVDTARAVRVAESIPNGVIKVAESGVSSVDDARRLADAGYSAVLVGEALVRSADPSAAVAELRVSCS